MAIKVIEEAKEFKQQIAFPKFMKFSYSPGVRVILLMKSKNYGIVLISNSADVVGDEWDNVNTEESGWSDFNEPLQNEAT